MVRRSLWDSRIGSSWAARMKRTIAMNSLQNDSNSPLVDRTIHKPRPWPFSTMSMDGKSPLRLSQARLQANWHGLVVSKASLNGALCVASRMVMAPPSFHYRFERYGEFNCRQCERRDIYKSVQERFHLASHDAPVAPVRSWETRNEQWQWAASQLCIENGRTRDCG